MSDDFQRLYDLILRLYRLPFRLALIWLQTIRFVLLCVCWSLRFINSRVSFAKKAFATVTGVLGESVGESNPGSRPANSKGEEATQGATIEAKGERKEELADPIRFLTNVSSSPDIGKLASNPTAHTPRVTITPPPSDLGINASPDVLHERGASPLDNHIHDLGLQLQLTHPDDPDRSDLLLDLGWALRDRFERDGEMSDLENAVAAQREALLLCPIGHLNRSTSLGNLANAVVTRFNVQGKVADLEEAIALHRQVLVIHPTGHPHHSTGLNNLAAALRMRFQLLSEIEDLAEAIQLHRAALLLRPIGHPDRSASLNNLANALQTRFQLLGEIADQVEAIQLHRAALLLRPVGHPGRFNSLSHLTKVVQARFDLKGDPPDLEEVITLQRHTLLLRPIGHPDRSSSLNGLGNAIRTRFKHNGEMAGLEEAITLHRQALLLHPIGHLDSSMSLNSLANGVWTRFEHKGEISDLEEAIMLHRQALLLHPIGHPDSWISLTNLGTAVHTRFTHKGEFADLEEAISLNRQALLLSPIGHPDRSSSLINLATTVLTRFGHGSKMADLEEAVTLYREALLLYPTGHPHHPAGLINLSGALQTRFDNIGEMADLEEAITLNRQALLLIPIGHADRSASLLNLANAVKTSFKHRGKMADLDEAIRLHRAALILQPTGLPARSTGLDGLANALKTRFEHIREMADLEEAIKLHQAALLLRPIGHPERSASLNNLANAFLTSFQYGGKMADLEEAIRLHRAALILRPAGHQARSASLWTLGMMLLDHIRHSPDSYQRFDSDARTQMVAAHALFLEGADAPATPVTDRFLASLECCELSRILTPESAVDAYIKTFQLLDATLAQASSLETRHARLSFSNRISPMSIANVATDASSCAIDREKIESAVELLEQGRTTILTQIGRYRMPLDDVAAMDADLAQEFKRLSRQLDASVVRGEEVDVGSNALKESVARYQTTVMSWDKVVGRIRALDGFHLFLRPTPFADLRRAAAGGPVIIVNINKYRSDAIIIFSEGLPCLVPLPSATPATVHQLADELAIQANQSENERAVVTILRTIWDIIVGPVVEALQNRVPSGSGSRIWWCPTSTATRLPLHAAGPYKPRTRNLPDMYISSYTSTLGALIRARKTPMDFIPPSPPSMLLVAQTNTPGQSPLPAAADEALCVRRHVPHATFLEGSHGTLDTVLSGLTQHSWVHLACHGHQLEKPFDSHFSLHDGRLRIIDIVERGLEHAELAVLSACHSAAGDKATPDEALHLTAAMQFAGFRSVIGTMWAMVDEDGPVLMDAFYKEMLGGEGKVADCTNAAAALSKAVKVLRRNKVPASRWINFVHYGA